MTALARQEFAHWLAALGAVAALAGAPAVCQAMGGGRQASADSGVQIAQQAPAATAAASRRSAMDLHAGLSGARPKRAPAVGGPMDAGPPPEVITFQPQAAFVGGPPRGGVGPEPRPFIDPAHLDHRWIVGPLVDEARNLPPDFPFAEHFYGSHDFQYCTRRDVYGDIYQAC